MDLVFLGTGGSIPTARRATACLLARVGGDRLLFDCGEGSQRQMQRSVGLVQVDEIFITHFHADHYLGVPGLLKTYDLLGRERDLRVIGPPGLIELFGALRRIFGRLDYEVELSSSRTGRRSSATATRSARFPVAHSCAPTATRWSRTSARAASTSRRRASSASSRGPTSAASRVGRRCAAPTGWCGPSR